MFFQLGIPEYGVVDAALFVDEVRNDSVKTAVVPGAGPNKPLRVPSVSVTAPRRDKRGKVAVRLAQRETVVTIPCVRDRLPSALGDGAGLFGRRIADPRLTLTLFVERLTVNCASGCPVMFSYTDHALAPV